MFLLVIEIIVVSILVNIFAIWIKLIPRYPKRKYAFLQQLINTGILTVALTILIVFDIYLSWLLLFVLVLFILWWSVRITNDFVRKRGESIAEKPNREDE